MGNQEYPSQENYPPYDKRNERPEPSQKKSDFGKGVAAGVFCTLFIVALVVGGIWLKGSLANKSQNAKIEKSGRLKEVLFQEDVEKKTEEITNLIEQYYYEDIDQNALIEGMYAGILNGLGDPYSTYFTAKEYESFTESTTGTYYGIGAVLTQNIDTKVVTILHVYPKTPAEEAGVKDGDVIVKVEDIDGDSMELSELVSHIKGEKGTTVHLELSRQGEASHLEFDVERREIQVPTVESQMLEGKVGLIKIAEFSENTPEQFDSAIKNLQEQGMSSMIIDLRDNPGGVLQSVCDMLDEILPEGLVVYTEDKYGSRSEFKSDANCLNIPMAVLINENSASASEIFAGAIKDYEYGTLIGTTSFGKGIVQTIIPLNDGSAVKITMAKYFTPKGNYIHGVGIEPDIELEYKYQAENELYNPMHDNQVLKALEILQKKE